MIKYLKKYLILFSALVFSRAIVIAGNIENLEILRGDINSQKALLLQKIEKSEASDELLKFKAGFLFENGDYDGCIEALKKIGSSDYTVNKLLALSYYYTGIPTTALYHFDMIAAEAEKSKDGEILFYRARTLEGKNLFEEALTAYGKIQEGAYAAKAAGRYDALVKNLP
ncbi:hypothetical protein KJ633_05500, partial [bacterium]|nr:hypothetical protein [bacterium]MBU3955897.1 hypothetical protein [bacterium]